MTFFTCEKVCNTYMYRVYQLTSDLVKFVANMELWVNLIGVEGEDLLHVSFGVEARFWVVRWPLGLVFERRSETSFSVSSASEGYEVSDQHSAVQQVLESVRVSSCNVCGIARFHCEPCRLTVKQVIWKNPQLNWFLKYKCTSILKSCPLILPILSLIDFSN